MEKNNLCQKHQEMYEFVCTNQQCENSCLLLCRQCLKNEHQICRKQNQITTIEKYSHKIISQLDEKIRKKKDLLNKLNESKSNSLKLCLNIQEVINQSRMKKQKAKLLAELKAANLFKEIKENLSSNKSKTITQNIQQDINQKKYYKSSKEIRKIDYYFKLQKHQNEEQVNENQTSNLPNHKLQYQITNIQETAGQKNLLQYWEQIQPQNSSNTNKLQLNQQFGREVSENSIEMFVIIKQKQWITYSDKIISYCDFQDPKNTDLKQFSVNNPIIDLVIDNKKTNILIHMENYVLIANINLKVLDQIQQKIKKNHISIYSYYSDASNLIYYNQNENYFVNCQIINNKITFLNKIYEPQLQLCGMKVLSIKLIKQKASFLFLVAFSNGVIYEYEMKTMKKIKEYLLFKTEYSKIQLGKYQCFGISEKNLYFMQYSNGSTQKILTCKHNIIELAAYVDGEKDKKEILILQQNNKVYKYVMNGNIIKKKQAKITDATTLKCFAEQDQLQFFIGFKNGKINCYDLN